MKIEHVDVRDAGTVATRRPFRTSGITSGYQRTNVTTSGATVIESTDGYLSIEITGFPWPELLSFSELYAENPPDLLAPEKDEIAAQGYKALSDENRKLAEELFLVDVETWPAWENK